MGKLHTKGGSECFLTDQWYRLDQWSPYLCEGHIEITSIWSKNLARYIPRLCIVRGENLERKHWSQTLRNWKRWTHLKSMLKNPMQRKCQRVWVVKSSNSLITDGIVKLSGRDQVLRTSTLLRDSHRPRRSRKSSRGTRRVIFGSISRLIVGWWWSQKWFSVHYRELHLPSSLWTESQTVRAQRSIIPNSTEIYRRYQNDRYFLGFFGTLMEIENGQIRGQVSQDSLYWMKETTRWVHMVGERLIRKQTTLRPATLWPEIWKDMTDAFKRKEQQKWAIEKPKLDNARRLRGVSRQKRNLLHLLTRTVPVSALRPVRLSRGDSASTTGTLDLDGEKKMPLKNKL